jgi:hypothetical protein
MVLNASYVCLLYSRFVENHPIWILEDGPLISKVVLSQAVTRGADAGRDGEGVNLAWAGTNRGRSHSYQGQTRSSGGSYCRHVTRHRGHSCERGKALAGGCFSPWVPEWPWLPPAQERRHRLCDTCPQVFRHCRSRGHRTRVLVLPQRSAPTYQLEAGGRMGGVELACLWGGCCRKCWSQLDDMSCNQSGSALKKEKVLPKFLWSFPGSLTPSFLYFLHNA